MKKYFVMCQGIVHEFFDTEKEASDCAESLIEDFIDDGEWTCECNDIFWGEVKQTGIFVKTGCNPDEYMYILEDL